MLESKIQKKIIDRLEQDGYFVIKLIKTNKNGIPDLLAIKKDHTMFIEVKQPKGVISKIQQFRHEELKAKGVECKIWTAYDTDF